MGLKLLIINPPIRLNDKPRNIPHGLAILANIIRKKMDVEPVFLDVNAYRYSREEVRGIIKHIDFDVVLMGGIASVYKWIVEITEFIKNQNPDSKIIAGGYVAMPLPHLLLKNSAVDVVCTGEGELTVIELLRKFEKKGLNADISDIKGVCYKEGIDNEISCTSLSAIY